MPEGGKKRRRKRRAWGWKERPAWDTLRQRGGRADFESVPYIDEEEEDRYRGALGAFCGKHGRSPLTADEFLELRWMARAGG